MNIAEFSRVEARGGMYGKVWEVCEGSEGLEARDAADWIECCVDSDKRCGDVAEYRFVPGRMLTDAESVAWSMAEEAAGRTLSVFEFLATLRA